MTPRSPAVQLDPDPTPGSAPRSAGARGDGAAARPQRTAQRDLLGRIDPDQLAALHRRSACRHFMLAARQVALLTGLPVLMWLLPSVWVWVPALLLQGFVFFGFSVLLHEVVHTAVFASSRPRANAGLALLYGMLGFLAPSQFRRWHLDHHRELGSDTRDPKRAELSPKRNTRRLKLLYFTPLLAPIYFAAAARAARVYPPALRRRIALERLLVIGFHGGAFAGLCWVSPALALAAHALPLALVYPVAFSINRLGQHYVIDPARPEAWTTRVRSNRVWDFLFLYSSHHLEHHFFPGVPCYRLPALQRLMRPVLDDWQLRPYGYAELVGLWLLRNHPPHSRPVER